MIFIEMDSPPMYMTHNAHCNNANVLCRKSNDSNDRHASFLTNSDCTTKKLAQAIAAQKLTDALQILADREIHYEFAIFAIAFLGGVS